MIEGDILRALSDPTRRTVFERLSEREMTVSELTAGSGVSQPAISQHLGVLRGAGLVADRRDGRRTFYRADPAGLDPLAGWIDRYRSYWPKRIEKLKTVLKEMER